MPAAEFHVERYRESYVDIQPGYLPVRCTREMQRLVRTTRFLRGLLRVRRVVGVEQIPEQALISLGCFGDTGGWRSKFSTYIDAQSSATA